MVVLWNQASTSDGIRDGVCDTMVDMTLNDLYAKVKVIGFGTNRFLIIRLL